MPNPVLYLQAVSTAAAVSMLLIVTLAWVRRRGFRYLSQPMAEVLALLGGMLAGSLILRLPFVWPPTTALQRLMMLVVPLATALELAAAWPKVPRRLVWTLRCLLSIAVVRCELHGSVYLGGSSAAWSWWLAAVVLSGCSLVGIAVWLSLVWLTRRSPGVSLPLSVAQAQLCAGLTIMLTGYLRGGEAALPLFASLAGVAVAGVFLTPGSNGEAVIGIGVVNLGALLLIGHFFGGLSAAQSVVIFCAPLLCGVSEFAWAKRRPRWIVEVVRTLLVAAPLLMLLVLEKQRFDREMKPLLTHVETSHPPHALDR